MTEHADSSRLMPTDADRRQSEGVVESRGVETLTDSTRGPVATDGSVIAAGVGQRPSQQSSLLGSVFQMDAAVALAQDENLALRKACAEALLSGGLLCAEVDRGATQWTAKPDVQRFLKALEGLREALS